MKFKAKPDAERRSLRIPVRVNQSEHEKISEAARIRMLTVSDFMRRAALGRKADVRYENLIILEVGEIIKALRAIHGAIIETGNVPPEVEMRLAFFSVVDAMKRISK